MHILHRNLTGTVANTELMVSAKNILNVDNDLFCLIAYKILWVI